MKKAVMFAFSLLGVLCGCVSTPQTVQQQLAERLDFANSTGCRLISPDASRKMAEQYFTEAEYLAAQQENRQFVLELTSAGAILYHASGLSDMLAAGESSRPLSSDNKTPVYFNRFAALAKPDTQGFIWHLLDAPRQDLSPFIDSLPEKTLFAGCLYLTPEAIMTALEKYADTSPKELNQLCQQKMGKSASKLLQELSGKWDVIVFHFEGRIHYRFTSPDPEQNLSAAFRILLPLLKRFLPENAPFPQLKNRDGKLLILSQGAENALKEAPLLTKNSPDLDYLIRQLPPQGNGFFFWSSEFSQFLLPANVNLQKNWKLPFVIGTVLSTGSAYDVLSLSNCDLDELQTFCSMLLPLRKAANFLLAGQQKKNRQVKANRALDEFGKLCSAKLLTIGKKLQEYADSHSGRFPANLAKLDLPGEKLLCPAAKYSPYVYFYGFTKKDNPHFPLVCDFIAHGNEARVLLLNGKVISLKTEGHYSLKRLVSTLHTKFRYPEKDLQMLLKKIYTVDKTME